MNTSLLKNNNAQTALLMILAIVIGLMFFAISLNLGKISQIKTATTVAATGAATQMTSTLASKAEYQIKTQLGGSWKKCKSTSVWVAIAAVIIAIIVVFATGGVGAAGVIAIIALVLAVANLVLQVAVIQPGLTSLWNKLQQNLSEVEQVAEGGISSGLGQIAGDRVNLPDRFDMDADGIYGINQNGAAKDEISRMGFYYTERLRHVPKPNDSAEKNFIQGLKDFMYEAPRGEAVLTDPFCKDPANSQSMRCNPCCVGGNLKPGTCGNIRFGSFDASQCVSNSLYWNYYGLLNNLMAENHGNATVSLREKLGFDDEHRLFVRQGPYENPDPAQMYNNQVQTGYCISETQQCVEQNPFRVGDSDGVYRLLWRMEDAKDETKRLDAVNVGGTSSSVKWDNIQPLANYKALNTDCGQKKDYTTGFWWKPGADQFCADMPSAVRGRSVQWPYNSNCFKHRSSASGGQCTTVQEGLGRNTTQTTTCGCLEGEAAKLWPEDNVDNLVYGLDEFLGVADYLAKLTDENLVTIIDKIYPDIAEWIAPKCDKNSSDPFAQNPNVCSDGNEGYLRDFWRMTGGGAPGARPTATAATGGWAKLIKDWKESNASDPSAWCGAYSNLNTSEKERVLARMSDEEKAKVLAGNNTLAFTAACLAETATNDERFKTCYEVFDKCVASNGTNCAQLPECQTLPRSYLDGADLTNLNDVKKSWDLAAAHKPSVTARAQMALDMKMRADDAYEAFSQLHKRLGVLLAPDGPADRLMQARVTAKGGGHPISNWVIYAWQGEDVPPGARQEKARPRKYWHIVKIKTYTPGFNDCANLISGNDKVPWTRTYQKGFLGTTRCYELTNANGLSKAVVTRWDEDRQPLFLANRGFALWKFQFGNANPKVQNNASANDIVTQCVGGSGWKQIGITERTRKMMKRLNLLLTEETALKEAFMLNGGEGDDKGCLDVVEQMLRKGVSSESCVRYDLDRSRNSMDFKFVKCPQTCQ